jgi:hypothetical protein
VSSPEPYFMGLSLARLDTRGDDGELRALLRDSDSITRPPFEGEDAASSVWVSVSSRVRVENVEFSRSWNDRLQPADVATALLESYKDAAGKAYAAAAMLAYAAEPGNGGGPSAPDSPVYELPPRDDDRAWLRAIRNTLEDIDMDVLRRARGETESRREDTVYSPSGCFRARTQGGAILSLEGDVGAIRDSSTEELRREALALFRSIQGNTDEVDH